MANCILNRTQDLSSINTSISNLQTNKQDKLVSGTNIKTINGNGLLGSGNIVTPTGVKGNAESTYRTGQVNLTPANIGAAAASHTHGYIKNDGTVDQSTVASGDQIVITDSNYDSKIVKSNITFGTDTAKWLNNSGTWSTPTKANVGLGSVVNEGPWYSNGTYNKTITIDGVDCIGTLTASQKTLWMFIPYPILGGTIKCTKLIIVARALSSAVSTSTSTSTISGSSVTTTTKTTTELGGGYPYMKYGTSYFHLNDKTAPIWNNSAAVYANSIVSVNSAVKSKSGISVAVTFTNALCRDDNDNLIPNNIPLIVSVYGTFTVS